MLGTGGEAIGWGFWLLIYLLMFGAFFSVGKLAQSIFHFSGNWAPFIFAFAGSFFGTMIQRYIERRIAERIEDAIEAYKESIGEKEDIDLSV